MVAQLYCIKVWSFCLKVQHVLSDVFYVTWKENSYVVLTGRGYLFLDTNP